MSEEFNYIVRIHGTNLDGNRNVPYALTDVKGIGSRLAYSIVSKLGIDPSKKLGSISDADVRKLEEALSKPQGVGIPKWMINRRKDLETGEDVHLLTSDLELRVKDDIERMQENRSWKGVRHQLGLKVRGQHTKTTARKGRSVGVSRRRIRERERERE